VASAHDVPGGGAAGSWPEKEVLERHRSAHPGGRPGRRLREIGREAVQTAAEIRDLLG
jgi:hypothetical protein